MLRENWADDSTGDDDADDGADWMCSACTYLNNAIALACGMCGSERPRKSVPPPGKKRRTNDTGSDAQSASEWACSACTLLNDIGAEECAICDTPRARDTATAAAEGSPRYLPAVSGTCFPSSGKKKMQDQMRQKFIHSFFCSGARRVMQENGHDSAVDDAVASDKSRSETVIPEVVVLDNNAEGTNEIAVLRQQAEVEQLPQGAVHVPYAMVARTFERLTSTRSRLQKDEIVRALFRRIIRIHTETYPTLKAHIAVSGVGGGEVEEEAMKQELVKQLGPPPYLIPGGLRMTNVASMLAHLRSIKRGHGRMSAAQLMVAMQEMQRARVSITDGDGDAEIKAGGGGDGTALDAVAARLIQNLTSAVYLMAPVKDSQSGGHRLAPDYMPSTQALGVGRAAIKTGILAATGASAGDFKRLYAKYKCSGRVTLCLGLGEEVAPVGVAGAGEGGCDGDGNGAEGGDVGGTGGAKRKRQRLLSSLFAPSSASRGSCTNTCSDSSGSSAHPALKRALSVTDVHDALLSLAHIKGTGSETRKGATVTRLLREALTGGRSSNKSKSKGEGQSTALGLDEGGDEELIGAKDDGAGEGWARGGLDTSACWVVRTLSAYMQGVHVGLEATVLPAMAQGVVESLWLEDEAHGKDSIKTLANKNAKRQGKAKTAQRDNRCNLDSQGPEANAGAIARGAYALHPNVFTIVDALVRGGVAGAEAVELRVGVPCLPMLANAVTSLTQLQEKISKGRHEGQATHACGRTQLRDHKATTSRGSTGDAAALPIILPAPTFGGFTAEFKYDGQRAQIHILPSTVTPNGHTNDGSGGGSGGSSNRPTVRIFSRKLDDMTSKYPDVVKAVQSALSVCALQVTPEEYIGGGGCILDAEIVPIQVNKDAAGGKSTILAFQALSTRKRKDTEVNLGMISQEADGAGQVRVCVYAFDLLACQGRSLLRRPFEERRALLHKCFRETENDFEFVSAEDFIRIENTNLDPAEPGQPQGRKQLGQAGGMDSNETAEVAVDNSCADAEEAASQLQLEQRKQLLRFLQLSIRSGCEGLMVKRLDSTYDPSTKRSDTWLKAKKDYLTGSEEGAAGGGGSAEGLGDSFDLVPIGGWQGQGRKGKWVSPWLLAVWDPQRQVLQSVCRVMSGFTDAFYDSNTQQYCGVGDVALVGSGAEASGSLLLPETLQNMGGGRNGQVLPCNVETGERCKFWFKPTEVWEIRGADISVSPVHCAGRGLIHPTKGMSLRFPRFIRKRPDKRICDATTPTQLAYMFNSQAQRAHGNSGSASTENKSGYI